MTTSFRGLSTFLCGAALLAFACFTLPSCQPSGGTLDQGNGTGGGNGGGSGSGAGGTSSSSSEGNGGNTGNSTTGGKGGGGNSETGGTSATGGKTSSGGSSGKGGTSSSGNGGTSSTGGTQNTGGTSSTGGTTGSATGGSSSTGGTTASATGGSGGGSAGALKCSPTTGTGTITTTGGLACPGGLCTVDPYAGYLYVYADGTSTICAGPDALCASGNTGAADSAGKIWGAGVGFNLDKSTTPADVQLSGTGLTYALSAMPTQGMRAQVSVGATDYCATLASASGTVAWTDFSTTCWNTTGTKLTGAPKTPHVGFQVTAATTAGKFDFCVKSVSFK